MKDDDDDPGRDPGKDPGKPGNKCLTLARILFVFALGVATAVVVLDKNQWLSEESTRER
jgi:hypothetical protein